MLHLLENINYLDQLSVLLEQTAVPIAISPQSQGGLVLINQHYSDLVSPGSRLIWPRHFQCKGIYAVGSVKLCTLHSAEARNRSLRNRISGLSLMGRILQNFDPLQRACLLVTMLCHRLGLGVVKKANPELLGALGRIQPNHIEGALHLYEQSLHQLGQTERMGDPHYLTWQRHMLSVSDLPLEDDDVQELTLDADVLADPDVQSQGWSYGSQCELAYY